LHVGIPTCMGKGQLEWVEAKLSGALRAGGATFSATVTYMWQCYATITCFSVGVVRMGLKLSMNCVNKV